MCHTIEREVVLATMSTGWSQLHGLLEWRTTGPTHVVIFLPGPFWDIKDLLRISTRPVKYTPEDTHPAVPVAAFPVKSHFCIRLDLSPKVRQPLDGLDGRRGRHGREDKREHGEQDGEKGAEGTERRHGVERREVLEVKRAR